jgi:hypothetical protein
MCRCSCRAGCSRVLCVQNPWCQGNSTCTARGRTRCPCEGGPLGHPATWCIQRAWSAVPVALAARRAAVCMLCMVLLVPAAVTSGNSRGVSSVSSRMRRTCRLQQRRGTSSEGCHAWPSGVPAVVIQPRTAHAVCSCLRATKSKGPAPGVACGRHCLLVWCLVLGMGSGCRTAGTACLVRTVLLAAWRKVSV